MIKKVIMILIMLSLLSITACDRNASNKEDNIKEVEKEVNTQPEDKIEPSSDNNIGEDYDKENSDEKEIINDEDNNEENYNEENEDTTLITHEDNPLLELASQGRIDGIDFAIDSPTNEIIEEWGLPEIYDYFLGGL